MHCAGKMGTGICRSIDAVAKPPPGTTDFKALFNNMTRNADYSIPKQS